MLKYFYIIEYSPVKSRFTLKINSSEAYNFILFIKFKKASFLSFFIGRISILKNITLSNFLQMLYTNLPYGLTDGFRNIKQRMYE